VILNINIRFRAGALATSTKCDIRVYEPTYDLVQNEALSRSPCVLIVWYYTYMRIYSIITNEPARRSCQRYIHLTVSCLTLKYRLMRGNTCKRVLLCSRKIGAFGPRKGPSRELNPGPPPLA